jgi:CheY-like chemotaxis protein
MSEPRLKTRRLDYPTVDFSMTEFELLMQRRIRQVLIISSNYDFFMLEEDGRIDEQIFNEYVSLSLRYPPSFIKAGSAKEAFEILEKENIDLVIEMLNIGDIDTFQLAKRIRAGFAKVPIVVLTHFNREVSLRLEKEDLSAIDYVFCWLGNADLLLAIIKLIEDRMNIEHDVEQIGVQTLMLVEDSIRYTSIYLPLLYKIVLNQSRDFAKEALNEHQKMLRMRGRPKIILAKNYDEAAAYYNQYKHNLLGIISDVSFKINNQRDHKTMAGLQLCKMVKEEDAQLPFLLQSSDKSNDERASELGAGFLYKYSKTLSLDVRNYIIRNFAFGEFVFRDPDTNQEIARAADLQALQQLILNVPDKVLSYHASRNDFSKWLNARAIFPVAQLLKYLKKEDFNDINEVRSYIFEAISSFRISKGRGIIAQFDKHSFDEYLTFSRIGDGSIGGKARGLAFINMVIKNYSLFHKYKDVVITIPRTVVLSTDLFDEFLETNDLYKISTSDLSDEEILNHFVNAKLPGWVHQDLYAFISIVKNPIAIRSSSKLEDSHYQPFAGIYSTYMIPIDESDHALTMRMLTNAIKSVYASVFFKTSRSYMAATSNVIDEEKMGIILQEVCGSRYGDKYYPTFSGVARSINFYPIKPEKPEDGIASVAFGLGKYIVDGGASLRFSPRYPKKVLQLSSPDMILKDTQKFFYALDMASESFITSTDDSINLKRLKIAEAEKDNSLKSVVSVFDYENQMIRDGYNYSGKKVVTFSPILNHSVFPLAEILQTLLEVGQKEMNVPIEIEFAVNMNVPEGSPKIFNFLQIRPIVTSDHGKMIRIGEYSNEDLILMSNTALGNGIFERIKDIVYIKPEAFDASKTPEIARRLEKLNNDIKVEKRNYILIGPGRWGSSDPWLGIPIKWPQISEARIIIESGLENFRVDPSQGTHFFQNLTSFGVGYMTINPFIKDGIYDVDYLNRQEARFEDEYIRHVVFGYSLKIMIDGRTNKGVIFKEGKI